ncbi:hypothetical protein X801_08356 [Opisthorchis viverrini]|uniref:RRM domain-containing protein n=1 Tax=Opisthorchis viverrini TaxID=6198 RepID=A0A1S8WN44_OPIVI|nr:hypothetical protein X801_08356 [Opisthorchis viverrini]
MSRVSIGHLPVRCGERDIDRFLKGYGRVRDFVLKNGYDFVEFVNGKDVDDAVCDLHGPPWRMHHPRLASGSRSGSRL